MWSGCHHIFWLEGLTPISEVGPSSAKGPIVTESVKGLLHRISVSSKEGINPQCRSEQG